MGGPAGILVMFANFSTAVYSQVRDPDSLVVIMETPPQRPRDRQPATGATWRVWQPYLADQTGDVSVAHAPLGLTLSWSELPEPVTVQPIAPTLLPLLGVRVESGRGLVESDAAAGAPPVAVISDTFWWTRFGASPEAIGQVITVDGTRRTIVGVMPRAFWVTTRDVDVWVPIATPVAQQASLFVVARLRPGDSVEAVAKRLDVLARDVETANPERERGWGLHVASLVPRAFPGWRSPLALPSPAMMLEQPGVLMLVAAAGLALIVACANVAMLMLSRGAARLKETAIRSAIGASRARLVRQFLIESTLVSTAGGALTLLVVYAVLRLIVANNEELALAIGAPRMDWRVIGGVLGLAAIVGITAGIAPAVSDSRVNLISALKETGFFSSPSGRQRLRRSLLVAEVALTVMLLSVVALLMRGAADLDRTPPGFDAEGLLRVRLDQTNHLDRPSTPRPAIDRALAPLAGIQGVLSASAAAAVPPGMGFRTRIASIDGRDAESSGSAAAYVNGVGDGYFRTLGLTMLAGRSFGEHRNDSQGRTIPEAEAGAEAVVSQAFARRYWQGTMPVGRTLTIEGETSPRIVVGVVSDQLLDGGRRLPAAIVFVPFADRVMRARTADVLQLLVRVSAPRGDVVRSIRQAVAGVDPLQTVQISAVKDVMEVGAAEVRVGAVLASPLTLLALLLTFSSVYGLLAQNVDSRAHDLAVRLTLGARRRDLFGLVIRDGVALSIVGAAIGIAAALIVDRFLTAFLFGVPGEQPIVLAGAALTMVLATVAAALVPYRRAVRIDPGRTLRYE
jgi:predicted permease